MARPRSVSDDEILWAAQDVILRRGYDGFTLSEVAREVGVTRSAIIQRFESTRALKVTLTNRMVREFESALAALPVSRSGDGLVALAGLIGDMIGGRERLGLFLRNFQAGMGDTEISALEEERSQVLVAAIDARMPDVAVERRSAVLAFLANLGGSILQWQFWSDVDCGTYLVQRTREWLRLAGVPFTVATADPAPRLSGVGAG